MYREKEMEWEAEENIFQNGQHGSDALFIPYEISLGFSHFTECHFILTLCVSALSAWRASTISVFILELPHWTLVFMFDVLWSLSD